jgi:hypothetical protein
MLLSCYLDYQDNYNEIVCAFVFHVDVTNIFHIYRIRHTGKAGLYFKVSLMGPLKYITNMYAERPSSDQETKCSSTHMV